jgi:hypothetical protein
MIEDKIFAGWDAVVLVTHAGQQHRSEFVAQKIARWIRQPIYDGDDVTVAADQSREQP